MLKGTSHKPYEVVSKLGSRELTVEKVAIYAVMAGAKPEYFPTILASATQAPSFGNSTSSMANMIVVNGPIRKQLGMNSGTDAMGPYSEANSIIGRTFTLAGKIMGDLRLNAGAYSSLGSALQYNNVCFAENEEELPEGWNPLSVEMGYKRTDNVVSVGVGWSYISSVGEAQRNHPPHMLIRDYMRSLYGSAATIVMDPTVASLLKDAHGFKTKAELGEWLAKNKENSNKNALLGARLRLQRGKIAEAEHHVVRENLAAAMPNLQKPRPGLVEDLAPADRASRDQMIDIGLSYYDALTGEDGTLAPFAEDCERRENGSTSVGGSKRETKAPASKPQFPPQGSVDPEMAKLGMALAAA